MSRLNELPLICVFGATGKQGGSVARYLTQSGGWRIRGVTRDGTSEKARKLSSELPNLELTVGDMIDKSSVLRAVSGCKAVFLVTDFYTDRNIEKQKKGVLGETEEGYIVAEACKQAGVEWFIISTLHNVKHCTGGRYSVAHFTGKNLVEQRARELGLNTLALSPGVFMQNWMSGIFPNINVTARGIIEWRLPLRHDVALPLIDIDQLGLYVERALRNPQEYLDKRILCASEYLTLDQCAAIYTRVSGVPTIFKRQTMEEYREANSKLPFVNEFAEMFAYFNDYGYYAGATLHHTLEHFPHTHTFREWLLVSGWRTDLGIAPKVAQSLGISKEVGPQHLMGASKYEGASVDGSQKLEPIMDFENLGSTRRREVESASVPRKI
jgi:uncharacterized protein YbjT (DUF2867 family)